MSGSSREHGTCPPWCQLPPGHAAGPGAAGERAHRRVVLEVPLCQVEGIRGAGGHPATIEVEAYRDPDGRQYAPTVRLTLSGASSPDDPDADDLTPAEARDLVGALLEAARLAES